MKKHFLFASLAISTLFTACSQEEELNVNAGNTSVNFAIEGIGSRTITSFENDAYSTVFKVGDNVGIYAFGGAEKTNSKFTVAEGIKLKGESISYKEKVSTSFKAYYPYAENGASTVQMTVGNQETGIDEYDFMTAAPAAVTTENTVNFKFVHQFAMVQVRVTGFVGETAKSLILKNIKPTVIWTAESNTVSEAEGTPTDIAMYNIKDNYFVALVPVQTIAAKTPMFYTTVGDKIYTFSPNKQISLTANKIAKFTIEIGNKVDMDMEGSSPEIGDWDNTGEEDGDFDMGADDVPAAPLSLTAEISADMTFNTVNDFKGITASGWSKTKLLKSAEYNGTENAIYIVASDTTTTTGVKHYWNNHALYYYAGDEVVKNGKIYTLTFKAKRGTKSQEGTKYSGLEFFVFKQDATTAMVYRVDDNNAGGNAAFNTTRDENGYYTQVIDIDPSKYYSSPQRGSSALNFTEATYTTGSIVIGFRPTNIDNCDFYIKEVTFAEKQ